MKHINLVSLTFTFLFSYSFLNAQNSNSIQILGGFISPFHSFDGLCGTVQIEKKLDSVFSIYAYLGYYAWDKNKKNFVEDHTLVQKVTMFPSYTEDNHELVPFYIGANLKLHSNNYFSTSLNFEFGYSYQSYYSYSNRKSVDPSTGEVLQYYVSQSSRKRVIENLFGIGLGVGVYRPLTERFGIIFRYKLNTHLNSAYNGFFTTKGTYSQFLAGFNFNL